MQAKQTNMAAITTRDLLGTLGLYSERSLEKDKLYEDFVQISRPSISGAKLTLEQFKAECHRRGYTHSKFIEACFRIFDRDNSGGIDKYEYALFRCATTNFDMTRDNSTPLIDLRLKIIFDMYDVNKDGSLEPTEIALMVRDMSASQAHVDAVLAHMGVDSAAHCTFETFCSPVVRAQFSEQGLQSRFLFQPNSESRLSEQGKVVISGRTVVGGDHQQDAGVPVSVRHSAHAINTGCIIDDAMIAPSHWRGLAVDKSRRLVGNTALAYDIAQGVIENARRLCVATASEDDMSDRIWYPHGEALECIFGDSSMENCCQAIGELAAECLRIVKTQPMCVQVPIPAKVFGDTHGQLRDLLLLFREFGFPSTLRGDIEMSTYVFNGDFVDRGEHQIEIVVLLFALKISYPGRIFLVRGNHEIRWQNEGMGRSGFKHQCNQVFGPVLGAQAFEVVHCTFDWLPIAAVVAGRILVVHGGIGDGQWALEDLEGINRPMRDENEPENALAKMVLWSDPTDGDETMQSGVHANMGRGEGVVAFSADVTCSFCSANGLDLVIRSHQLAEEGYKIMHKGHMITVFSARNYADAGNNDSALILIAADDERNIHCRAKKLARRF